MSWRATSNRQAWPPYRQVGTGEQPRELGSDPSLPVPGPSPAIPRPPPRRSAGKAPKAPRQPTSRPSSGPFPVFHFKRRPGLPPFPAPKAPLRRGTPPRRGGTVENYLLRPMYIRSCASFPEVTPVTLLFGLLSLGGMRVLSQEKSREGRSRTRLPQESWARGLTVGIVL
jgi:hypothetical protein